MRDLSCPAAVQAGDVAAGLEERRPRKAPQQRPCPGAVQSRFCRMVPSAAPSPSGCLVTGKCNETWYETERLGASSPLPSRHWENWKGLGWLFWLMVALSRWNIWLVRDFQLCPSVTPVLQLSSVCANAAAETEALVCAAAGVQADRAAPQLAWGHRSAHSCSWGKGSFCPEHPHLFHARSYGAHLPPPFVGLAALHACTSGHRSGGVHTGPGCTAHAFCAA